MEHIDKYLKSETMIRVGSEAWCASVNCNLYYTINLESGEVHVRGRFENEQDEFGLYFTAVRYENEIFWIPYSAKEIAVYNLGTDEMKKYKIPFKDSQYAEKIKFGTAVLHENCIYAFGYGIPVVLKINCQSKTACCIDLAGMVDVHEELVFFKGNYVLVGQLIYLPFQQSNKVLEFDLSNQRAKCYTLEGLREGNLYNGYTLIEKMGSKFILYNWLDEKIEWDLRDGSLQKNNIGGLEGVQFKAYKKIIYTANGKIYFPWFSEKIIVQKYGNSEVKRIDLGNLMLENMRENANRFTFIEDDEEKIWFQISYNRDERDNIFIIDKASLEIKKIRIWYKQNEIRKEINSLLANILGDEAATVESVIWTVKELIDLITGEV